MDSHLHFSPVSVASVELEVSLQPVQSQNLKASSEFGSQAVLIPAEV